MSSVLSSIKEQNQIALDRTKQTNEAPKPQEPQQTENVVNQIGLMVQRGGY